MPLIKIKPKILLNLLISILTGVFAQLSMKYGMMKIKGSAGNLSGKSSVSSLPAHSLKYKKYAFILKAVKILTVIFMNKFVIAGIALYLISMFFWIKTLSKIDLSVAYPFVSIGVVLTVILAAVALNEPVPLMRWVGIFVTLCGVYVIVSSHEDGENHKNEEK
ncbi:MAG: SMR family transporter [Candidatus Acidulodesulfobacterium sp.]